MPNYVARASVTAKLPSGYSDVLDNDRIDDLITNASGEIEEMAGTRFSLQYETSTQKFPEITDSTYTTPKTIELCALWLTLSYCYEELADANRGDVENFETNKVYYRRIATEKMEKVADGEIDLGIGLTTKIYATEKYPDDESSFDRVFTNTDMDTYYP